MDSTTAIALIAPLLAIELTLKTVALVDVWRRKDIESEVRWGWTIVIALIGTLGWLVYFIAGRRRQDGEEII